MTVTTQVRSRRTMRRGPGVGSLGSPFARHLLVLAGAAAATYVVAGTLPAEQLALWAGAGAVLGAVAALVARRLLGVVFLVLGLGIGLLLHLHLRLGSGEEAIATLGANGGSFASFMVAAAVGYVMVAVIVTRLGAANAGAD